MSSQDDIFASQQNEKTAFPGTPRVSSTCPASFKMWKWVVLFVRDETVKSPFVVHPVSHFEGEIKDSWVKSLLSTSARKKPIQLSALQNRTVSLFGKIESSK